MRTKSWRGAESVSCCGRKGEHWIKAMGLTIRVFIRTVAVRMLVTEPVFITLGIKWEIWESTDL